jgi:TPP-dependent pyruvate/acetoin dehydrogenase alpha subunit
MDSYERLYEQLYTIRRFEEMVLENFASGVFSGTTHTSLGQEANAVGVLAHLAENDVVVSNHRCHGHFLAYGGDPQALFAELMGKPSGVCGGVGGSQHLHWRNFYSNGIQGGTVAMATGMALAEKRKKGDAIVFDFMGDGTLGEGIVYECLNMASLWSLPILYILENNHIAQTTPADLAVAGSIPARFEAFGIPATHLDTSDVMEIKLEAGKLVGDVRKTHHPRALVIETTRLGPHSKGDDTREKMDVELLWTLHDPVEYGSLMLQDQVRCDIIFKVRDRLEAAFEAAMNAEGGRA